MQTLKLYAAYAASQFARTSRFQNKMVPHFVDATATVRRHFIKAMATCLASGLTTSEYIAAQYWWFEKFKREKGRLILPQPFHLHGANALIRVKEWKAYQAVEKGIVKITESEKIHKSFARENRKLKKLVEYIGIGELEVLRASPLEFSPAFLQRKGVWSEVQNQFD